MSAIAPNKKNKFVITKDYSKIMKEDKTKELKLHICPDKVYDPVLKKVVPACELRQLPVHDRVKTGYQASIFKEPQSTRPMTHQKEVAYEHIDESIKAQNDLSFNRKSK